jgi:hypothetical protein
VQFRSGRETVIFISPRSVLPDTALVEIKDMNALARKDFDIDSAESYADFGAGPGMTDFCSREGAMRLKEKIEAYWRERGQPVQLSLHNVGFHPAIRAARYDVRSDMVNGMPRGGKKPSPLREVLPTEDVYIDDESDIDIYAND